MANQKFDFGAATQLQSKLASEANKIEADLKQMVTQVEGVRSWCSGGSEEAFINNFKATKETIVKSLNTVIDDYKKLIDQIATIKRESDADLARQLGGKG